MKRIVRSVSLLMVMVMAIMSLNITAIAAPVDTREQEAITALKEVVSNLDSQAKEKYVMILEKAASEGNPELLNNHKKHIDKNYKPTGKKLSAKEFDIANKIVFAASNSAAINFASMNLPLVLESTLYAIAAALGLSYVPTVGQIVTLIVGAGAIVVFIIYRKEFMANFSSIVKEFKRAYSNIASSIVSAFNQIKARVVSEATSVSVSGKTITVGNTKYKCTTVAEEAVATMQKKKINYYPAVLAGGAVWVSPVPIDRNTALAIMRFNSSNAGVFAISSSMARGLCSSLGGVIGPQNYGGGDGYWSHYHGSRRLVELKLHIKMVFCGKIKNLVALCVQPI